MDLNLHPQQPRLHPSETASGRRALQPQLHFSWESAPWTLGCLIQLVVRLLRQRTCLHPSETATGRQAPQLAWLSHALPSLQVRARLASLAGWCRQLAQWSMLLVLSKCWWKVARLWLAHHLRQRRLHLVRARCVVLMLRCRPLAQLSQVLLVTLPCWPAVVAAIRLAHLLRQHGLR